MKLLMTKKKKNISNQQSRSPQRTRFNFEISLQTSFVAYLTRKKCLPVTMGRCYLYFDNLYFYLLVYRTFLSILIHLLQIICEGGRVFCHTNTSYCREFSSHEDHV